MVEEIVIQPAFYFVHEQIEEVEDYINRLKEKELRIARMVAEDLFPRLKVMLSEIAYNMLELKVLTTGVPKNWYEDPEKENLNVLEYMALMAFIQSKKGKQLRFHEVYVKVLENNWFCKITRSQAREAMKEIEKATDRFLVFGSNDMTFNGEGKINPIHQRIYFNGYLDFTKTLPEV